MRIDGTVRKTNIMLLKLEQPTETRRTIKTTQKKTLRAIAEKSLRDRMAIQSIWIWI